MSAKERGGYHRLDQKCVLSLVAWVIFRSGRALLHKSADGGTAPYPLTDLSCDLRDADAERNVAVQHGNTNLELRDLAVEVPRHEALTKEFEAVHFRFCAASSVILAPPSPKCTAVVLRGPQRLVARDRTCRFSFPWLGVLARRDHDMGRTSAMAS